MKRLVMFLALFSLLIGSGFSQASPTTKTAQLTAAGSTCILTTCISQRIPASAASGAVQLSGTFTSSIVQFEASSDGINFIAIPGIPLTPGTGVTSVTTTPGIWRFELAGLLYIRVRCSTYSAGPVIVTLTTSLAAFHSQYQ